MQKQDAETKCRNKMQKQNAETKCRNNMQKQDEGANDSERHQK